jgi:hypothetical protein
MRSTYSDATKEGDRYQYKGEKVPGVIDQANGQEEGMKKGRRGDRGTAGRMRNEGESSYRGLD